MSSHVSVSVCGVHEVGVRRAAPVPDVWAGVSPRLRLTQTYRFVHHTAGSAAKVISKRWSQTVTTGIYEP